MTTVLNGGAQTSCGWTHLREVISLTGLVQLSNAGGLPARASRVGRGGESLPSPGVERQRVSGSGVWFDQLLAKVNHECSDDRHRALLTGKRIDGGMQHEL
jgi:hypothetical protein